MFQTIKPFSNIYILSTTKKTHLVSKVHYFYYQLLRLIFHHFGVLQAFAVYVFHKLYGNVAWLYILVQQLP